MKGDKTRVTDRTSYENNWNTIFGKREINAPAVEAMIERANHKFPGTLGALAQLEAEETPEFALNTSVSTTLEADDTAKKLEQWSMMVEFLERIRYSDYPVQEAQDLLNQINNS